MGAGQLEIFKKASVGNMGWIPYFFFTALFQDLLSF